MRLSLQLYTVRHLLEKDLEGTLKALKGMGLNHVELAGTYGKSNQEWKTMLDSLGLKVSGAHTGLDRLENDFDGLVEEARTLGYTSAIVGWIDESRRKSWVETAKLFDGFGRKLKDKGLTFAYHNHDFEFQPEGGKPGLDVLYENSDPSLVKAQLDIAWVQHGGQNPAEYIRKYGNRLDSVHLKDMVATDKHVDVVAGTGNVNWDQTLKACDEVGVATGSVEMDNPPGDALDSVRGCLEFFQKRGIK